jgi:hypothetical protein
MVEAEFPMPKNVAPQEVDAFVLDWSVSGGALAKTERTSFIQDPDEPDRYYYYDPWYYYGPWRGGYGYPCVGCGPW